MKVSRLLQSAAVLAVTTVVAACASTDYHYSQLSGTRYYRVPIDTYPVSIVRVDGVDVMQGSLKHVPDRGDPYQRPVSLVDPGFRQVTVQGPPGGTGGVGEQRTVPLEIAPCTRYYLVAVKSTALANDFTVRIDHQEPVSGCTPA
jgi:hypothetical protein